MTNPSAATVGSPLAQVVCEVPRGVALQGFRWYEVSLDDPDASTDTPIRPLVDDPQASVIAATHTRSEKDTARRVSAALDAGFQYVLFESTAEQSSRELVERARAAGARSIATRHLPIPTNDAGLLAAEFAELALTRADFIKIAYPAYTPSQIASGLTALERAQAEHAQPVSVTPMGTVWGRLCAAAAGSRFVFAPLLAAGDRPSAGDMLRLLEQMGSRSAVSST